MIYMYQLKIINKTCKSLKTNSLEVHSKWESLALVPIIVNRNFKSEFLAFSSSIINVSQSTKAT
jgi:hypothetical protein